MALQFFSGLILIILLEEDAISQELQVLCKLTFAWY